MFVNMRHICQAERRTNRLLLSVMCRRTFTSGDWHSMRLRNYRRRTTYDSDEWPVVDVIANTKRWVEVTSDLSKNTFRWFTLLYFTSKEMRANSIGCRHISAATSTVIPLLFLAEVGSEWKGVCVLRVGRGVWLACNCVWPLAGPWLMQVWASEWTEVSAQWHMTCHG